MKRLIAAGVAVAALTGCGGSSPKPAQPTGSRSAGQAIEQHLQAGWNQYKFDDEPIMAGQLGSAIKSEPTLTQVAAVEYAFIFASGLEIQQRLKPGDAQLLVAAMKGRFANTRELLTKEVMP
jgi:hypothetical protein